MIYIERSMLYFFLIITLIFLAEISVSNNFMETEAYSLRFGEFKAIGKKW